MDVKRLADLWFSGIDQSEEDQIGSFYCPYTDEAVCALMVKGWEVQELCWALDCPQLRFFQKGSQRTRAGRTARKVA
ncbi:MAG: hypothetical protein ACUVRS_09790 [Armatimonadota bacterium]